MITSDALSRGAAVCHYGPLAALSGLGVKTSAVVAKRAQEIKAPPIRTPAFFSPAAFPRVFNG